MSDESLWIFGYGSLVWRPAFAHLRRRPAYIEGYARRFWQGSTDHRGVPGRPGRVVTLLPEADESVSSESGFESSYCWGTAYEVPARDPDGVLARLDHRERGGYGRLELEISLAGHDSSPDDEPSTGCDPLTNRMASDACEAEQGPAAEGRPNSAEFARVRGLVYIAGPHNDNYLGPASVGAIARQIATAHGPSGANPEYVFELARSLHAMGVVDAHVFDVARAVRVALAEVGNRGQRDSS